MVLEYLALAISGKDASISGLFITEKLLCNFENQDCRDFGVLEQVTNSSLHYWAMLRRAQVLSEPPLMPRTFSRSS